MGKYDNIDRDYFTNPERAAELFYVGIHRKRLPLSEQDIEKISGKYPSLSSLSGELERDGLFICHKHRVKYGLEIENHTDLGMPRRFFSYDACDYEMQTKDFHQNHLKKNELTDFTEIKSRITKEDRYFPLINLLLFVGQGHWTGGCTLRELFLIPDDFKEFIHDKIQNYSFCILEADYINPEDFQTDLKYFFQAMQCRRDKKKLRVLFEQDVYAELTPDAQRAISLHLGIKKLTEKVIKGEQEMCKAYRELIHDERKEARDEERIEMIKNLTKTLKCSLQEAMDFLLIPEEDQALIQKHL